eukprot:TRINITY_DN430_c1_g1_i2.p1 TRINITY_DN430_c1_g1~~TRINITY_DN430_c1_g1_i2.p1  ORF type:complete len:208 (-),score=34.27 TRINITY_DN430_c1_g1_i2:513-1136(-)
MKSAIIFACLLLFSAVANASLEIKNRKHYSTEEEMSKMFEEFQNTYNKEYEHEEAKQGRYEVFKNNLKKIDDLNVADPSGVYSVNEFTDMTEDEFNRLRQSNYAEVRFLPCSVFFSVFLPETLSFKMPHPCLAIHSSIPYPLSIHPHQQHLSTRYIYFLFPTLLSLRYTRFLPIPRFSQFLYKKKSVCLPSPLSHSLFPSFLRPKTL